MWNMIKSHPWIAGGAIGLLLLVLVFSSSSGTTAAATPDSEASGDGSGDQLQAYMAQLNLQGQALSAQSNASSEQTAAALQVAQINASSTDLANTLAAQVAEFTTKAQSDTIQHSDTLSAQVAQAQIAAGVQNTQLVTNALVQQQSINADVSKHQTDVNAAILSQSIYSQTAVQINAQNQNYNLQSQNNGGSNGLLSFLF